MYEQCSLHMIEYIASSDWVGPAAQDLPDPLVLVLAQAQLEVGLVLLGRAHGPGHGVEAAPATPAAARARAGRRAFGRQTRTSDGGCRRSSCLGPLASSGRVLRRRGHTGGVPSTSTRSPSGHRPLRLRAHSPAPAGTALLGGRGQPVPRPRCLSTDGEEAQAVQRTGR